MPTYLHFCKNCNQEFEDFYSIKADPPTKCLLCEAEGQVTRLISGGSGRGKVELTGRELIESMREEGRKERNEIYKSETKYANIIGESKYQSIQQSLDKRRR
jgi:putative FmdB family regulatory protein